MSEQVKTRVEKEHRIIGNQEAAPAAGFARNDHPGAQWFNGAGLGLFIHYGLSALDGTIELSWGLKCPGPHSYDRVTCGEWGHAMLPRRYWAMAKDFRAENFNPGKWLAAAKRAGFRYAVLTTRHHDGFALWPSDCGNFSTKNHLQGRDLVGEFVAACREHDLKVGLYYSGPDWYYLQDYTSFSFSPDVELGIDFQPEKRRPLTEAVQKDFRAYLHGQLTELLTRYGKIDLLWFDGSIDGAMSHQEMRALQPGMVFNTRGLGYGDFRCCETYFPKERMPPEQWFECCHVFTEGAWGYMKSECYRPIGWFCYELSRIRAWGGNLLINMGPQADGDMPAIAYRRLEEIKGWMDQYSDSVSGVEPGPWPERANVPVTIKGNVFYLHAHWRTDFPLELMDVDRPQAVQLFDGTPLPFTYQNRQLKFVLPWEHNHHTTDVVKVIFQDRQK
ncbi:MAG: hypothetical protein GX564_09255 [Oligosphaeraceae bacterium]|nr:hypothetical protein [Oligosphaeraceae bacterium]